MEVSSQLHALVALPSGERAPGTHWLEGCVGPRVGLDTVEKRKSLAPVENRTPTVQPVARHEMLS
jgi:hypothetical protein